MSAREKEFLCVLPWNHIFIGNDGYYSPKEQEEFPSSSIAVVHFSIHTLEKAPSNIFNYLALTKDQWNLQKWREIDRDTRKKTKYFFLPNLYDADGQFTVSPVRVPNMGRNVYA